MERAQPQEIISDAEARFDLARRTAGFFVAPAVFLLVWLLPLGLDVPAHRLAAIASAVIVLWVCESLPMAVTALLGPLLAVVFQIAPARRVFAPCADPIVFLFIGGFMIAEAMFVHGLDRRAGLCRPVVEAGRDGVHVPSVSRATPLASPLAVLPYGACPAPE